VEEVLVEGGRCVGVRLRATGAGAGRTVRAREAVVSNTDMWTLAKLIPR
jgi:phytoene dehydrogenase-like protein